MSVRQITLTALFAASLAMPVQAQPDGVSKVPVVAADPTTNQAPGIDALIAAGETQLAAGEAEAAIATLEQAVATDPKSSMAHTRLGGARLMHRDYSAAILDFRNALAADPNNADAFVGMAVAYLHNGDYQLARAALGEARRLAPAKGEQIDKVTAYMDEREGGAETASH
jgi:Flp pilus assembly protein TadD